MYAVLTIQERLKDLRVERGLTLEQLAEQTGIARSTLSNYEADDDKDISHTSIVTLVKFYSVSADYLLGLTEQRTSPDVELSELHLSDAMLSLLKSGRINTRLLCELTAHEDFVRLMIDMEIYIDRLASMNIENLNLSVDGIRAEILARYQPDKYELYNRTLEVMHIQEDEYFSHLLHDDLMGILRDLRQAHKKDSLSAPEATVSDALRQTVGALEQHPGSTQEKQIFFFCQQMGINYKVLTATEISVLTGLLKKVKLLRSPMPGRGKGRRKK